MNRTSEFELENFVINVLKSKGYKHYLGESLWKRKTAAEILFLEDLKKFLSNSSIEKEVIDCLEELPYDVRSANAIIWSYIQYGIWIKSLKKRIQIIDFEHPEKNYFKAINQLSINTGAHTRRPDLLIYINGIPLIIFELKSPKRRGQILNKAYEQLTFDYLRDIREIFKYTLFLVVSNGHWHKYGTINIKIDEWHIWDKDALKSLLSELFEKKTLLDYIKNFIYITDEHKTNLVNKSKYELITSSVKQIELAATNFNKTPIPLKKINPNYETAILLKKITNTKQLEKYSIIWFFDKNDRWLDDIFSKSTQFIEFFKLIIPRGFSDFKPNYIYLLNIQEYLENPILINDSHQLICISHKSYKTIKHNCRLLWRIKNLLKFKNKNKITYYNPNFRTFVDYLKHCFPNAIHLIEESRKKESKILKILLTILEFIGILLLIIIFSGPTDEPRRRRRRF